MALSVVKLLLGFLKRSQAPSLQEHRCTYYIFYLPGTTRKQLLVHGHTAHLLCTEAFKVVAICIVFSAFLSMNGNFLPGTDLLAR